MSPRRLAPSGKKGSSRTLLVVLALVVVVVLLVGGGVLVVQALNQPTETEVSVEQVAAGRTRGSSNAKVKLVVFSDFQ